jgi:hypothetical protein
MFQYASLKGISNKNGYKFCIPPKQVFGNRDSMVKKDMNLYDIFDIESKNIIKLTNNTVLQERSFGFDDDLFNNFPDNVDLNGYYQTERYFKHIEDEIRKDFSFSEGLESECKEFIDTIGSEIISLHIRRGDYVINPNHPVQPIEYYKKALELLPSDLPILVFSDDFKWCKDEEFFDDDRFLISTDSSVDVDLCLMSLCDYHIIANSSFSWWGSWLAKSKKTIAPKNWFDGSCINYITEDIYCSDWIIL